MKSRKKGTDEPICKTEIDTEVENNHMDTMGLEGSCMSWEIGIDVRVLLGIEQTTNENRLHSTRNSA